MDEAIRKLIAQQVELRTNDLGRQILATAQILRRFAGELRSDELGGAAFSIADSGATVVERAGRYLESSDFTTLVADAERFGRRRPIAVAAGGFFLGVAASRTLKAAAARRHVS